MEHLPIYIPVVFILTTALTLILLYKASKNSKPVLIAWLAWLGIQAALSLSGFYKVVTAVPPRFALLVLPPILFLIIRLLTKSGRAFFDRFNVKTLTLLHIVRIPVELTLYWLCLYKTVPVIMTFEGQNFDIFCGLTAPLIYYFGYIKNVLGKKVLIGWNILCLLLLTNILVTAVLSAPFSIQKFGFDQPNIALLYFPFIWLPCCIVPIVLMAHIVSLMRLFK